MSEPILALEMLRCSACGLLKLPSDFAFSDMAQGTRNYYCRECHARYRRGHYERNRDDYIRRAVAQVARKRQLNRERIREYLLEHPCMDCGETRLTVLEFDHRDPRAKLRDVAWLAMRRSWKTVLAEIEKCDVRCANCHRRRTARERGWSRSVSAGMIDGVPRE